jgi:hypothetical protein
VIERIDAHVGISGSGAAEADTVSAATVPPVVCITAGTTAAAEIDFRKSLRFILFIKVPRLCRSICGKAMLFQFFVNHSCGYAADLLPENGGSAAQTI